MLKVAAPAMLLFLGACSSPSSEPGAEPARKTSPPAPAGTDAPPSKPSPPKPAPTVLLSPGGLVAAGRLLRFGIPRAEIEDSSLGLLFSSGDLTGLLDQDGIEGLVTDIWAGTVCLID